MTPLDALSFVIGVGSVAVPGWRGAPCRPVLGIVFRCAGSGGKRVRPGAWFPRAVGAVSPPFPELGRVGLGEWCSRPVYRVYRGMVRGPPGPVWRRFGHVGPRPVVLAGGVGAAGRGRFGSVALLAGFRRVVRGVLGQDAAVWLGMCRARLRWVGGRRRLGVSGDKGAGGRDCCRRLGGSWCSRRVGSRGRVARRVFPRYLGVCGYSLSWGPLVVVLVPVPSGVWVVVAGFRAQLSRCVRPCAR